MASSLKDTSDALAAAVEAAGKSTVTVSARRGRPASGIVWDKGVVLTSSHAIENEDEITVDDGDKEHKATLVGRDAASDLAVLRVDGLGAAPASRGGTTRVGELVLAVGRAPDLRATLGVVGATTSRQRGWRGGGMDGLLLTDARLYQGFSGGPLVNAAGEVVGVNSWYYGAEDTKALPVAVAERVAQSLLAHGKVKQPYLGIGTQPVYLPDDVRSKVGQDTGLMVINVEAGSPAAGAGVMQGDTLVGIDDTPVTGMRELFSALRGVEVGSEHTLKVVRAGAATDVKVKVGEREPQD
ncbi:MAG: hypothetical protein QOE92_1124 [Chloroflexota bacterium]|jgi:S1-C subfamily serine protease|nr:hypothetical protein [Chloroflexota bacterium]